MCMLIIFDNFIFIWIVYHFKNEGNIQYENKMALEYLQRSFLFSFWNEVLMICHEIQMTDE